MSCTNCPAEAGPLCAECDALLGACDWLSKLSPSVVGFLAREPGRLSFELSGRSYRHAKAILDPARLAEMLPAMLEVRGLDVDIGLCPPGVDVHYAHDGAIGAVCVPRDRVPSLLFALLAIPRQALDARERTLAALEAAS